MCFRAEALLRCGMWSGFGLRKSETKMRGSGHIAEQQFKTVWALGYPLCPAFSVECSGSIWILMPKTVLGGLGQECQGVFSNVSKRRIPGAGEVQSYKVMWKSA